jgi:hypothetical protein
MNILFICSKTPAQILDFNHKKAHFLTLYLLHFLTLYPLSKITLPEGLGALPGNLEGRKMCIPPLKYSISLRLQDRFENETRK